MPDDRLSRMVSAYWKMQQGFAEEFADLQMFYAPSECHGVVARSQEKREDAFYKVWNTTPEQFKEEIVGRTSYKWAYFNLGL